MENIIADLSPEEVEDLESYINEFVQPLENISILVEDMMSTDSSREKLAEDIIKLFTEEGIAELEKCLEKN